VLRTDIIDHRSGSAVAARRDVFGQVWARLESAFRAAATAWIVRRDERALMEKPDDLLKDIGIGRGDIPRAVREGRF
jgi:uncharacterized protein YjiS (DUF1127 family)